MIIFFPVWKYVYEWFTYESVADINYIWHPQTFYEKFKQSDFSLASPRTLHIRGRCHKDITDGTDVFMDKKYDP